MSNRLTITDAKARSAGKGTVLRDSMVKGFHLKVTEAGSRCWMYAFRLKNGERRNPKLGEFPAMHAEEAREKARGYYLAKERGEDPTAVAVVEDRTFSSTKDEFVADYGAAHWGSSQDENFDVSWRCYIEPHLGDKQIAAVTWREVDKALKVIGARSPAQANRVKSMVKAWLLWAERKEYRLEGSSDLSKCVYFGIAPRKRNVTKEEWNALTLAMAAEEKHNRRAWAAVPLYRLLILTGRRLTEFMDRLKSEVEFYMEDRPVLVAGTVEVKPIECARVYCPTTKSGRKKKGTTGAQHIYLGPEGAAILRSLLARGIGSQWLFPGGRGNGHLQNPWSCWWRILERAGIEDLQLKDFRHYFITFQLQNKVPVNVVADMVGHADPGVTMRHYAYVLTEMRREEAAKAEAGIAARLLPLPRVVA